MNNNHFRFLSVFLAFFLICSNVQAYWVWSPSEGKFISPEAVTDTQKTASDLFQSALKLREEKGKDRDIIRLLQHIVRNHSQSAYAPEAQFLIATIFEEQEKPLRAAAEFKKLVREFPRNTRIEESIDHLFKIGNFFLTGEKQKVMGVAIIPVYSKAVDVFKFIVEQAPYGSYGDQAQLKLGTAYRKMGSFNEAVNAFQTLIANYPTSPLVDEAHYQLAETSYELSQTAIRDQSTTFQASSHLKDFIKQYGASSLAERAKILKQRLDEQDSEKNYRVGLYYEKQGAIESALIYYEDIAGRYPETPYGQKAVQRLKTLQEPIHAMEKGEAAIQQRIAEVRSMLQALEQQETSKEKGKKAVSETGDTKQQLKQELSSLLIGQKEFKNEAKENFGSRKRAFKERQKNLREKFKIFKSRKKQLMKNPSPELQTVLDKWHASLVVEQEELAHDRQTLNEIKSGLKQQKLSEPKKKSRIFGWMPGQASKKERQPKIVFFNPKKWNKFQKERTEIVAKRKAKERELRTIEVQIQSVEEREFDLIKNIPNLDQLLPADLLKEKEKLKQQKSELDESIRAFEQIQKEFQQKFGLEFVKSLGNESEVSKFAAINSLIASGENLEQILAHVQLDQASLSEAWLAEKEQFAAIESAFEEGKSSRQKMTESLPVDENGETTDQATQARVLKKRMKYLEREIRSRVDQIQDWNRDNARRMKKLNELLQPESPSGMSKTAEKILNPAKGTYKLTKAFFLGLENNDQKLMEQANAELKKSQTEGGVSGERAQEIRELQEEIELQSILIQGRTSEINDLQVNLSQLQKQARAIPGFSYQSLLVERIPTDLAHTVNTAKKLVGLGVSEADIQKKLDAQSQELIDLERRMTENRDQIEIVNLAIEQKKGTQTQAHKKASILPSISGDAETLPQEGEGTAAVQENSQGEGEAQTKLIQMKAEINMRQSAYQQSQQAYNQKLLDWYRGAAGQNQLLEKSSGELKQVASQKAHLQKKKEEIQILQSELLKKETALVKVQKGFTDQKMNELEDRLEKLKNPSDSAYQALMSEIKSAHELRDSLIHDLSTLQSSQQ